MKEKIVCIAAAVCLLAGTLSGCGAIKAAEAQPSHFPIPSTVPQSPAVGTNVPQDMKENVNTAWLPSGVKQQKSETKKDPDVEKAIKDYYKIPDEELAKTRYFYNYVDLNDDGSKEIFAVVSGPYTSGTAGDSALWLLPGANMSVMQAFTGVRAPVIVSDEKENGVHKLVLQRLGEAADETVELTCTEGEYSDIQSREPLESIDKITGTAIICDDMTDSAAGIYLAK